LVRKALLVIDVKNDQFSEEQPITYPHGSLDNIVKAMKGANQKGIPVIVIQHTSLQKDSGAFIRGSKGWQLHEAILKQKHDCLIEKNLPGSFTGTRLEEFLKENDIDTVVISGYMTQMCCDTTSRQAFHLGFAVEFLSDATGTLDVTNYAGRVKAEEVQRATLVTQAMQFAKVMTTGAWLKTIESVLKVG
jgi:nicotinamidase-related amidase